MNKKIILGTLLILTLLLLLTGCQIDSISSTVIEQKKVSLPTSEFKFEKEKSKNITIGIKNLLNKKLHYRININLLNDNSKKSKKSLQENFQINYNNSCNTLKTNEISSKTIEIKSSLEKTMILTKINITKYKTNNCKERTGKYYSKLQTLEFK